MEDYDQDAFLSLGKEDFVALMGRSDSQYLALAQKVGPVSHVTIASGHGGRQWRQYNLQADSYVMMARLDHGLTDSVRLGLDLGVMNEKGSVLGSLSTGALSLGKGRQRHLSTRGLTGRWPTGCAFSAGRPMAGQR